MFGQTYSAKPAEVEKKWIVIDAEDAVVGRLAIVHRHASSRQARADYTPHVDCGDYVVVINADKVKLTGRKLDQQDLLLAHRPPGRHQGTHRGARSSTAASPSACVEKAVERMLPKESPLGRKQLTHLRIYNGAEHPHAAQNPETLDVRRPERQERAERLIMAETLNVASSACKARASARSREAAASHEPEARRPGPRLRHRQAQERHRPRLDQAGQRQDHHQRPRPRRSTSPARCCG